MKCSYLYVGRSIAAVAGLLVICVTGGVYMACRSEGGCLQKNMFRLN